MSCKEYLEKSLQDHCAEKCGNIFLMPYEERLCGFSRMGFHVNFCLCVSLINVLMLNACML